MKWALRRSASTALAVDAGSSGQYVEDEVAGGGAVGAGGDDLVGLRLRHALVVRSMDDQDRRGDLSGVGERRTPAELLGRRLGRLVAQHGRDRSAHDHAERWISPRARHGDPYARRWACGTDQSPRYSRTASSRLASSLEWSLPRRCRSRDLSIEWRSVALT